MTSQTSTFTGWRRAATGATAASALLVGMLASTPFASADPATPTDPASPTTPGAASNASPITPGGVSGAAAGQTSDQTLLAIAEEYDTGAGGGKISTLIHRILKLRAQGYRPSKGNAAAVKAALDKRPNQTPLIEALDATLAYQLQNQSRDAAQQSQGQSPTTFGINQLPPGYSQNPANPNDRSGVFVGPDGGPGGPGTINVPLG